jgi:hypothetical protein
MTAFLISQLCASYRGEDDFFTRFQSLARCFCEVEHIDVLAVGERRKEPRPGKIFASAPVRYLDEVVGEVHLFFDILKFPNDRPLHLVKFLAKHLGMAIQSAAVYAANEALQGHLAGLKAEVDEHKLLERARGVIESRRLIPAGEGQRLMKKVSDQSGKALQDVAQRIIDSAHRIRRDPVLSSRMPQTIHYQSARVGRQ